VDAGAGVEASYKEEPMTWFTIRLDKDGYRARLWSGSDLIWWTEGYEDKRDALNAVRIAKASYSAPVHDRTEEAA
jgi:uncharacterized protein YegP (UPF0339 family)